MRSTKQIDAEQGYFVPLGSLVGKIYSISTAGTGAGGSYVGPVFSTASWAAVGGASGPFLSTISSIAQGGLLRDMGRTIVSANRTFRKVQLLTSTVTLGGVAGTTPTNPVEDFLTGYIEMGFGSGGTPAPVAAFGR